MREIGLFSVEFENSGLDGQLRVSDSSIDGDEVNGEEKGPRGSLER
jgi:hypothetical protein